jgi:type I restriction enzyme M protein
MTKPATTNLVQRLWGLCNILRDDGITYQDYVTELTYLLFLKMLAETGRENLVPTDCRWDGLTAREGDALLTHYRATLLKLGTSGHPGIRSIFDNAQTSLRKPANLRELVGALDKLDWYSAKEEGLGDLYEGLLEKNANEKKSGAGQYFTPRALIDCMVRLLQPQPGEVVQDPAAGTGGFLVAADRYIKDRSDELFALPKARQDFQRREAFRGLELVPGTHRLLTMNLLLHGIEPDGVKGGDALGPDGEALVQADLILSNPPFGTKKGGGRPVRGDFTITAETSNKQLAFVEHIVRGLKPGGRAGIVLPDNVLFADGVGRELRRWMMDVSDLHTILRLPTGIFYAQGVKTNVVFLRRGTSAKGSTQAVWVYDMRAGQPAYGKTRPLRADDFSAFVAAYGDDPNGSASREDSGPEGRFRRFTREEIAARAENLDIAWLRGSDEAAEDSLEEPKDILDAIGTHLARAMVEVEALAVELNDTGERAEAAE